MLVLCFATQESSGGVNSEKYYSIIRIYFLKSYFFNRPYSISETNIHILLRLDTLHLLIDCDNLIHRRNATHGIHLAVYAPTRKPRHLTDDADAY